MSDWRKTGLIVTVAVALSALAAAQDRNDRGYNDARGGYSNGQNGSYPGGSYGNNDPAYRYGYKDGFDLGANAARTGAAYNDHGSGAYNHADNGFPGGDKGAYQQRYRQAYTQGYRAGYQQVRSGSAGRGDRDYDRDGDRDGSREGRNPAGEYGQYPNGKYRNNDPAYQYGYKDGFNLGANAARTRAAYNDRAGGAYDHADNGFPGGDKGSYQQRYRQAYVEGYREGYRQIAGQSGGWNNGQQFPNNGQYESTPSRYNNPAYQNGYKDGFDLGANDARTGAPYNDHGSGAYDHADHGFPGGDKGTFQQQYRQAYTQGYRAGYEQARGAYGSRR